MVTVVVLAGDADDYLVPGEHFALLRGCDVARRDGDQPDLRLTWARASDAGRMARQAAGGIRGRAAAPSGCLPDRGQGVARNPEGAYVFAPRRLDGHVQGAGMSFHIPRARPAVIWFPNRSHPGWRQL